MRIIVEGLIGVGKSTFTTEASELFNLTPMYESVDDNPFLEKFYTDESSRWAYTLQMHFLMIGFQNTYQKTLCLIGLFLVIFVLRTF